MRTRVVKSLLKKEFLNIIRDRKSFIIMILLPLLMFPLLIGLMSIILTTFTKVDDVVKFGVNYEVTDDFRDFVNNYSDIYKFEIIKASDEKLKDKFDNEEIKIYILKKDNTYELHYDGNNTTSVASSNMVENMYKDYKEEYISEILAEMQIDYEKIKDTFKIDVVQESVTEMGSFVPSIISMVLVMIISSVCFSVAIDVTTSEKEKGTLETLLSLPIRKTELITSKFFTVFLLSAMSGFLTYISLFCTLYFAGNILSMLGVVSIKIDLSILFIYLISIILISLLFSGLLLSVTIFSKNLKEAQNSLYPLELFVTFVSMLPMLGVKASNKLAIIPFVNISLLFNNVLSTQIDSLFIILTFASTIIYSALLIMIISKLYNQEDVLFNTKALSYISFKNGKSRTTCFSTTSSLIIAGIVLLLGMYFTIIFMTASKYFLLALLPITTFIVVAISSLIVHLDVKESFKLNKFSLKTFMILLMICIGTFIISNFTVNLLSNMFPKMIEQYSKFADVLSFDNLPLAVLVIAVLPAIFEELLFRGIIFTSFNKRYNPVVAILVSALIFGIYHMNWIQGINAFIMGLMLAYSYYKSKSLFVPIIFHFINNFISTLMSFYENLNFEIPNSYSIVLLICAIFLIISSCCILESKDKSSKQKS